VEDGKLRPEMRKYLVPGSVVGPRPILRGEGCTAGEVGTLVPGWSRPEKYDRSVGVDVCRPDTDRKIMVRPGQV